MEDLRGINQQLREKISGMVVFSDFDTESVSLTRDEIEYLIWALKATEAILELLDSFDAQ